MELGRVSITGAPVVYIEQMAMEAAMLSLWQGEPANLTRSVNSFEDSLATSREEANSLPCRRQAFSRLLDRWKIVRPQTQAFGRKFTYSANQIIDIVNEAEDLNSDAIIMQTMFEEIEPRRTLLDSGAVHVLPTASLLFLFPAS